MWTEANPSRAMNSTASNDDDMLENGKFLEEEERRRESEETRSHQQRPTLVDAISRSQMKCCTSYIPPLYIFLNSRLVSGNKKGNGKKKKTRKFMCNKQKKTERSQASKQTHTYIYTCKVFLCNKITGGSSTVQCVVLYLFIEVNSHFSTLLCDSMLIGSGYRYTVKNPTYTLRCWLLLLYRILSCLF